MQETAVYTVKSENKITRCEAIEKIVECVPADEKWHVNFANNPLTPSLNIEWSSPTTYVKSQTER